ncbi:hypothetical protein VTI74DRAFT_1208 [Chaetomium olivicolor]
MPPRTRARKKAAKTQAGHAEGTPRNPCRILVVEQRDGGQNESPPSAKQHPTAVTVQQRIKDMEEQEQAGLQAKNKARTVVNEQPNHAEQFLRQILNNARQALVLNARKLERFHAEFQAWQQSAGANEPVQWIIDLARNLQQTAELLCFYGKRLLGSSERLRQMFSVSCTVMIQHTAVMQLPILELQHELTREIPAEQLWVLRKLRNCVAELCEGTHSLVPR